MTYSGGKLWTSYKLQLFHLRSLVILREFTVQNDQMSSFYVHWSRLGEKFIIAMHADSTCWYLTDRSHVNFRTGRGAKVVHARAGIPTTVWSRQCSSRSVSFLVYLSKKFFPTTSKLCVSNIEGNYSRNSISFAHKHNLPSNREVYARHSWAFSVLYCDFRRICRWWTSWY